MNMQSNYRGEIDGLRAFAVVPVILFHAGIQAFSGGFVGVDVFFVISGYLITSILLNELKAGSFSIVHFYERRARRILPALYLVMLLSLPFAWFWLAPRDLESYSKSLAAVSAFISNFLFWHQSGYFDSSSELKPLIHTWSLAVEEQFYLIFPLFLMLIWKFGKHRVLAIFFITFLVSLFTAQWGSHHYPAYAFFMLPTRAWELIMGAFIAFYHSENKIKHQTGWMAQWGSLLGLLLILYSVFSYNEKTLFPGLYALVPTVGAALIIIFATHKNWVGKTLSSKPLVGIGLVSYSAYLWHQPIFAFVRHRSFTEPSTTLMLSLSAISFLLAYLSWRYVERPFRNKHKFTRKQVFLYGATGSLCFILIGSIGQEADRFTNYRISKAQLNLIKTAERSPKAKICHTEGEDYLKPEDACEYFGHKIKWAVLGDSHAIELAYALATELKSQDLGIKELTFSGCSPSYGTHGPKTSCAEWTDAAVAYLDRTTGINTVVISYRLNKHLFGDHSKTYPGLPNEVSESNRNEIWQNYIRLLRHLTDSGKRVIVVLQAPEVRKPMADLIFSADDSQHDIISVPKEWWQRRNAYVTSRLNTIPPDVMVINPADFLCDELNCYSSKNGIAFYHDDHHMSVAGANTLAHYIFRVVQQ